MNPDEITIESLKDVDIESLALDKEKFGANIFEEAHPQLEELKEVFVELQELGYKKYLLEDEVRQIDQKLKKFIEYLRELASFDPAEDPSFSGNTRENFEQQINNFHKSTIKTLRSPLTYLRQQVALESKDEQELQEERKAVAKAREQSEKLLGQLREEYKKLKEETAEVEQAHGEKAATTFGKHFESQANEYAGRASDWFSDRKTMLKWLFGVIIVNLILYFFLFITNKLDVWPNITTTEFFTLEYGIVKLALVTLLSYVVGYSSKHHRVNLALEADNLHRKNVAETLKDYINSIPVEHREERVSLTKTGAEAMFTNPSDGYSRTRVEDGPVREIVTNVISKQKDE